jgi:hypothetical protein
MEAMNDQSDVLNWETNVFQVCPFFRSDFAVWNSELRSENGDSNVEMKWIAPGKCQMVGITLFQSENSVAAIQQNDRRFRAK